MLESELFIEFQVKKSGRSWIITPDRSEPVFEEVKVDNTILKVLVKAHLWQRDLNRGRVASMKDLAKHKGVDESYVRRLLTLNYLSPKLKDLIMNGKQPKHLKLQDIIYDVPLSWEKQEQRWLKY